MTQTPPGGSYGSPTVRALWRAVEPLGAHLGPALFQLPPNFKKDALRLKRTLASLGGSLRAAGG